MGMLTPLTPVLTARQRLVCVDPACVTPILPGDAVVMLARGWVHAVHGEAS